MDRHKNQKNDKEIKNNENMITPCRVIFIPTEMPPMMKKLYPEDTKKSSIIEQSIKNKK